MAKLNLKAKRKALYCILLATAVLLSVLAAVFTVGGNSASPVTFNATYGGQLDDQANDVVQTSDGGYALAGWTNSYSSGFYSMFWLVKTDSLGNQMWAQTYGAPGDSKAYSIVQSSDGGYALGGYTNSSGNGIYSFWLVKTNSAGNVEWNQTYGGTGDNKAYNMIQTSDGGYALAGYTTTPGVGGCQMQLVKTDSSGNLVWSQTYGGAGNSQANSVIQTSDGGYLLAGSTDSTGNGGEDMYVVKVDGDGAVQWANAYGGQGNDYAYSAVQTNDGGYSVAGSMYSYSDGYDNFWLIHLDSSGNMVWNQTYDAQCDGAASRLITTADGGYCMVGSIDAGSGEAYWLVKTDNVGGSQWNQTYSNSGDNEATALLQTNDSGYAIAGYTDAAGAGGYDFNLVKTTSTGAVLTSGVFRWNSLTGFLIIAVIVVLVAAIFFFAKAQTRRITGVVSSDKSK